MPRAELPRDGARAASAGRCRERGRCGRRPPQAAAGTGLGAEHRGRAALPSLRSSEPDPANERLSALYLHNPIPVVSSYHRLLFCAAGHGSPGRPGVVFLSEEEPGPCKLRGLECGWGGGWVPCGGRLRNLRCPGLRMALVGRAASVGRRRTRCPFAF